MLPPCGEGADLPFYLDLDVCQGQGLQTVPGSKVVFLFFFLISNIWGCLVTFFPGSWASGCSPQQCVRCLFWYSLLHFSRAFEHVTIFLESPVKLEFIWSFMNRLGFFSCDRQALIIPCQLCFVLGLLTFCLLNSAKIYFFLRQCLSVALTVLNSFYWPGWP